MESRRWYKDRFLYISFAVCFLMALVSFGGYIWSGDGVFTLMTDFNSQQIPFAVAANDAIKNGEWGWLWNVDLGTNLIGAFSFYNLGSPFFWLSLLFPAEKFPYVVGWLFVLKYASAGAFSYLYIRRFVKHREWAVLGAVLYAFSGFQSVNLMFNHFHEVVAFFPLLLLGLEKLVVDKKHGYFAAAVSINSLLNYYFFAGEVIFLVIYFLCRFGLKKESIRNVVYCCVEGIIGIGMACILFLPSLIFISSNPKAAAKTYESGEWFFTAKRYLEILKGMLLPAEPMYQQYAVSRENFTSTSMYLPGVGAVLVIAYVMKRKGWIRRLVTVSWVISLFPVLNSVFTAFSQDYRRWWYMPALIMALASAAVLDKKEKISVKPAVGIASVFVLLYWVIVSILPWSKQNGIEIYHPMKFVCTILLVLISNVLMLLTDKHTKLFRKTVWGLVIAMSLLTTVWMIYEYRATSQSPQELAQKWEVDRTLEDYDINYRWDADNSGMYIGGVHPLRTYNSTITGSIFEMHQAMRLSRTPAVVNLDVPGVMEWLGGKYYITAEPDENVTIIDTIYYGDEVSYIVDQNACPIGFTYDSYLLKSEYEQLETPLRGIAVLMALIIPDEKETEVSNCLSKLDISAVNAERLQNMEEYVRTNVSNIAEISEMNSEGFRATKNSVKDTYVFFSVPNDAGWSAYVNGQQVDILNINGMMAIRISAGASDIRFHYEIPGFKVGCTISLISIAVWTLYVMMFQKLGGRRKNAATKDH